MGTKGLIISTQPICSYYYQRSLGNMMEEQQENATEVNREYSIFQEYLVDPPSTAMPNVTPPHHLSSAAAPHHVVVFDPKSMGLSQSTLQLLENPTGNSNIFHGHFEKEGFKHRLCDSIGPMGAIWDLETVIKIAQKAINDLAKPQGFNVIAIQSKRKNENTYKFWCHCHGTYENGLKKKPF